MAVPAGVRAVEFELCHDDMTVTSGRRQPTDGSLREYRAWRPGVCSAAEGEELRPATVGQVFSSTRCFW
jgi:hypothetical protein